MDTEKGSELKNGRRLLLAADETSLAAVTWAADRLLQPGDIVSVLNVDEISPPTSKKESPLRFDIENYKKYSTSHKGLLDICETLRKRGISFDGEIRKLMIKTHGQHTESDPHDVIIEAIDDLKPNLVIMGASKRISR